MTPELKASISTRARALQVRLNEREIDWAAQAERARRIFEDAGDAARARWMTLELGGYAGHAESGHLACVVRFVEPRAVMRSNS